MVPTNHPRQGHASLLDPSSLCAFASFTSKVSPEHPCSSLSSFPPTLKNPEISLHFRNVYLWKEGWGRAALKRTSPHKQFGLHLRQTCRGQEGERYSPRPAKIERSRRVGGKLADSPGGSLGMLQTVEEAEEWKLDSKMAHRLLVRRIWTLSVREIRHLPASTAAIPSSSFSTSLQSATTRVSFLSPSRTLPRSLPHTSCRAVSFNVQDHEDFTERVINSELPVLVDFHAQWCGPCKILGPRLEKAVAKQKGRVAMAKVDIDDHTDLAIEYGVSAVPTVIAMRGGDVVDHFVGIKDDDELDSFVSKIIGQ
ncbi:thioredoxin, mitochondrial [Lates japonicus]|uniref:Thioredoxin, mitochondrial n=1 Tax=Lates japonicus TaxID=270547 RepID=A0AAD3RP04_LATJO|nr:thioredoxin, mitochondrial [Lates japonicus]